MAGLRRYPVPWRLVLGLAPHIARGTREDIAAFSAAVAARLRVPPQVLGLEKLPASPRFVLAPNHYQREGLWILHPAAVMTDAIRGHYGLGNPPVRWIVTANWPPWRAGPWRIPSPGDRLLPRVAHALWCFPVSFAGSNPSFTARTYRSLLRELDKLECPIGLFPEGVAGAAGRMAPPLPGVGRLVSRLAAAGWPVVPAGIREERGLVVSFGEPIPAASLATAPDPAGTVMRRIAELAGG